MTDERGTFAHSSGYTLDYLVTVPEVIVSPYLHVLFHGFSRIESHVPPVFARRQWRTAGQSVCLLVSDPIHNYTKNSACGWFLLGEDEFRPRLLDLRQHLVERFGLRGTVWHGLSSGGYAALKFCVTAGDGLAFVIAPHNDPTVVPQWQREAVPFLGLPGMARPEPVTDLLRNWVAQDADRYLYAVVTEHDAYFALHHLRPILASIGYDPSSHAVALRDGRGHGFIADADYDRQLTAAITRWERHRADHRALQP
ncbi:hypothetical protein AB0F59_13640 [Micromonospora lupini]|uniref:hypothetical protein n=1 Tax=Micromonospora lupini TaxID=285679 RepID=UPI0033CB6070